MHFEKAEEMWGWGKGCCRFFTQLLKGSCYLVVAKKKKKKSWDYFKLIKNAHNHRLSLRETGLCGWDLRIHWHMIICCAELSNWQIFAEYYDTLLYRSQIFAAPPCETIVFLHANNVRWNYIICFSQWKVSSSDMHSFQAKGARANVNFSTFSDPCHGPATFRV